MTVGKIVQQSGEFPGFKILGVIPFFELIEFLKDRYRDRNVMFIEVKDGVVFV